MMNSLIENDWLKRPRIISAIGIAAITAATSIPSEMLIPLLKEYEPEISEILKKLNGWKLENLEQILQDSSHQQHSVVNKMKRGISTETILGELSDIQKRNAPAELFLKGDKELLSDREYRITVIGSRRLNSYDWKKAQDYTKFLVKHNVIVTSGAIIGINAVVYETAIRKNGHTIAVLDSPLNKPSYGSYANIQYEIGEEHLLVSPFAFDALVTRWNFRQRNIISAYTIALISDATIIISGNDASEDSIIRHCGFETLRLGRSLFILSDIVKNPKLRWPGKMINSGAIELADPDELHEALPILMEKKEI